MNISLHLVNNALAFAQNGTTIPAGGHGDIDLTPGNTATYGGNRVIVNGSFKTGVSYELCGNAVPAKNKKFYETATGKEVGSLK
jgi:hypothetical protein